MNFPELADLMIRLRKRHRFFRQEGFIERYMICECGARILMVQEDPWDDFEAHRVEMIINAMIKAGADLR